MAPNVFHGTMDWTNKPFDGPIDSVANFDKPALDFVAPGLSGALDSLAG